MQHKACADNVLHCDARKQQECKPPLQRLCRPVRAVGMVPAAFLLVFRGSFFNLCNLSNLWMICSFFPCRRTTAYGLPPFFWFIRRKRSSIGSVPRACARGYRQTPLTGLREEGGGASRSGGEVEACATPPPATRCHHFVAAAQRELRPPFSAFAMAAPWGPPAPDSSLSPHPSSLIRSVVSH